MIKSLELEIHKWCDWIKNEKRLTENTVSSYIRDIRSFMKFLHLHYNNELIVKDMGTINEDDLTGWFFQRIKRNISKK